MMEKLTKIKEKDRQVRLFIDGREEIYPHSDIVWSDLFFLRFYTQDGEYKVYSGSYAIEDNHYETK